MVTLCLLVMETDSVDTWIECIIISESVLVDKMFIVFQYLFIEQVTYLMNIEVLEILVLDTCNS